MTRCKFLISLYCFGHNLILFALNYNCFFFSSSTDKSAARPWETQHGSSSHDPQGQLALLCDNKLLENNNLGGKGTVIKSQLVDFSTN